MKTFDLPKNLTKEDHFLLSHILDGYQKYKMTHKSEVAFFLDEYKQKLFLPFLLARKIPFKLYAPHPLCTKKVIYFGEEDSLVTIYYLDNQFYHLRHKDILGSLFALGLTYEVIGDIFVEEDRAYFVVLKKIETIIDQELKQIGNKNVVLEKREEILLEEEHYETLSLFVASNRLDLVLARLIPCSRKQAIDYLENHKVFLNNQEIRNASYFVQQEDILSIRTVGKFKIGMVTGKTKSNKLILEVIKYR